MKLLTYTSPARGHLFPVVPILDELQARGHEIAVRTLASEVDMLRERGFQAAPLSPAIEALPHDDYKARSPLGAVKRAMANFGRRAPHEVDDLRGAIEAERPDALLVDAMTFGASAVAEAHGAPWAQWFPYPLPLPSPDVPPFGPGLPPASGPLGRVRDRLLTRALVPQFEGAAFPQINAVRESVGVRPLRGIAELYTSPPLMLYLTAEPFEYPRSDWPPSIRMVGPCAWEPPGEAPAWLDGLERPLVLVSTSSEFQDDGRLVSTALEALRDEPVEVVATLPSAKLPDGPLPVNVHVAPFIPHTPLLGRAACAITHGGAGATQKALAAGVPVCVVPFGRDQLEVARRVAVARAGTRLSPGRLNAERLRRAVREAMTMTEGARRVAEGFARAGGPAAAADALEELVPAWAA